MIVLVVVLVVGAVLCCINHIASYLQDSHACFIHTTSTVTHTTTRSLHPQLTTSVQSPPLRVRCLGYLRVSTAVFRCSRLPEVEFWRGTPSPAFCPVCTTPELPRPEPTAHAWSCIRRTYFRFLSRRVILLLLLQMNWLKWHRHRNCCRGTGQQQTNNIFRNSSSSSSSSSI